jgi:hypothetical protein
MWTWAGKLTPIHCYAQMALSLILPRYTNTDPRTSQESELAINIRKATSIEEVSPKRTSAHAEAMRYMLILV